MSESGAIASADIGGHRLIVRERTDDDVCPDASSEWENWGEGDRVAGDHLCAVVVLDDTIIGTMSWHAVFYGPTQGSRAWSMGIALAPEWRGLGWGSHAQRLLSDHLLTGARRVEASTDIGNLAEQRSLEKAGFLREGVLKHAQERVDGQHDLVMYARTRSP